MMNYGDESYCSCAQLFAPYIWEIVIMQWCATSTRAIKYLEQLNHNDIFQVGMGTGCSYFGESLKSTDDLSLFSMKKRGTERILIKKANFHLPLQN